MLRQQHFFDYDFFAKLLRLNIGFYNIRCSIRAGVLQLI